MPYIHLKTNVAIPREKEQVLADKFADAMKTAMGKNPDYMMVYFDDNCKLYFGGSNAPAADIQLGIYASGDQMRLGIYSDSDFDSWNEVTELITEIVNDELAIPKDRIYLQEQEYIYWGHNGQNFAD